jgi:ribosomal protein L35
LFFAQQPRCRAARRFNQRRSGGLQRHRARRRHQFPRILEAPRRAPERQAKQSRPAAVLALRWNKSWLCGAGRAKSSDRTKAPRTGARPAVVPRRSLLPSQQCERSVLRPLPRSSNWSAQQRVQLPRRDRLAATLFTRPSPEPTISSLPDSRSKRPRAAPPMCFAVSCNALLDGAPRRWDSIRGNR